VRTRPRFGIPPWTVGYPAKWLGPDAIAGLTVTALLVPEGLAYAQLAGVPPQTAFYAAPVGLLAYAWLGSSRQLVVAVSSAVAVLSFETVSRVAAPHTLEFIAATAALALMVGAIAMIAGLLRLGRVAQFFSESVLDGFVTGLALTIIIKQLPKLLGIEGGDGGSFRRLRDLVLNLDESQGRTMIVGFGSLLLMILIEQRLKKLPAALVVLIAGIVFMELSGWADDGVAVVGDIRAGLIGPALPHLPFSDVLGMLPWAIGIVLVAFAESIGPARLFARSHGYRINADQELVALGGANLAAGAFQGFSIGSSLSKSAANDLAGARSPMSLVVAAASTALVALFFSGLFSLLPEATLAAIVIVAVWSMVKVDALRRLARVRRTDLYLGLSALIGVLIFGPLIGLLLAVAISIVALAVRSSRIDMTLLGIDDETEAIAALGSEIGVAEIPGIMMLRPEHGMFFANAAGLTDLVLAATRPPARTVAVVLDLEATSDLDVPGADALGELAGELARADVSLHLARVHHMSRGVIKRSGVLDLIGADHVHARVYDAVAWIVASSPDDFDPALVRRFRRT
jgi:SulP family sulfate permease